ncbi:MAG: pyridoxamine 5'-phosphate oxidase [Gemmataceae bacterium]|nr:pyridoxamine 5'-phosphate oxidase [Gemmataceae bacterium]
MKSLADLRQEYPAGGLSEADAGDDPIALFRRWFDQAEAAGLAEPNAFALATATPDGAPSVRFVLLKALDDRGFTFFTNYDSRKGRELAANARAAMCFLWHPLERQVRVEGTVEVVTPAESDEYYARRPPGSRLGALASPQSAVIPDRAFLEARHAELMAEYPDGNPPRPANWGGYRLLPASIEFWQGRPSRLHDRIRFARRPDGSWHRDRLAP